MATPDDRKSSAIPSDRRGWALENVDATVRVKPRRPYTPYNLFYLLERELVVQGHEPSVAEEAVNKKSRLMSDRSIKNVGKRPEEDIPIPSRYKNVVLLPYWYEPNLKEKRKHRKTHGKISFKELTGIISKNWANIDAETKDYCTRVSLVGRKRYKETITRYNAAQKIVQLKKEKAAMENARELSLEQSKKNTTCSSPPRPEKGYHSTPSRILSHHAPIVTPPRSGYSTNRTPTFAPSSGAHAFHLYGPAPPLPPPMPHHGMPGQHPPSMSVYHHHHQQHIYRYHQAPAMSKTNTNGYHQAFNSNNAYHHDYNSVHSQSTKFSQVHGGHSGDSFLSSSNQGIDGVVWPARKIKTVEAACFETTYEEKACVITKKEEHQITKGEERKTSMTHDEAMRLCDLIGNDAPVQLCALKEPQIDTLLCGVPSFDFGDHHSLSTEDDADLSKEFSIESLLIEVENQGDIFLDLFD